MYEQQALPTRDEVQRGHQAGLDGFAQTGTWLRGDERVAVLKEVRHAAACELCAARKSALSPYAVDGQHDSLGDLPENFVEVIHRIKTDSGRLTLRWYESIISTGLSPETYVELVGLIATAIVLDSYAIGLGLEPMLPDADSIQSKTPSYEKNAAVVDDGAWVPLLDVPVTAGATILPKVPNIGRSMGLVPAAMQHFFVVMRCHYNLTELDFDIERSQVELIAARMSSHNACFY